MASTVDFHSQIASIMEVLANAAVAEICKLVDDGYSVIQLEVSRSQKETEILRKKIKLLELQVARYRAERLKASEGSLTRQGFPVTRHLLGRQGRDPSPGTSQQTKNRYLNRGARSPQSVQKPPPIILDQDPDQEVVTTTKTEPAEPEEEEQQQGEEKEEGEDQKELVIVKVEGGMEIDTAHQGASSDADIIRGDSDPTTSFPTAMREDGGQLSETEAQRRLTFPYSPKREPEKKGDSLDEQCPAHLLLNWQESRHSGDTEEPPCSSNPGGCTAGSSSFSFSDIMVALPVPPISIRPVSKCDVMVVVTKKEVCDDLEVFEGGVDGRQGQPEYLPLVCLPPGGSLRDDCTQSTSSVITETADFKQRLSQPGVQQEGHLNASQNLICQTSNVACHKAGAQEHHLPFTCSYCSRRFTHQSKLLIHERSHTGERPYQCAQCGKTFAHLCSLKQHKMVHTGERPFPCSHCGKKFSTSTNLKVHQSVHTGEKRFHCSKCGRNFSFNSNLIKHRTLHCNK